MLGEASQRREKGRESRQITITSRGWVAGSYARLRAREGWRTGEGGVPAGVGVLGQRHKLTVWGGADGELKVVAKEGAACWDLR